MGEAKTQDFIPREYQVDLLEKALKKNIIVCLGTGAGKTFIAVMLIKELITDILKPFEEGGKRTFFITKTVPLVDQQAKVLRMHTGLNVGEYVGSMGVDYWDKQKWNEELRKCQILVMTNQILTNLVCQSFIKPDIINLLIIDECHHAVGNDPIVQLMRRFLDFGVRPKILGLTASVLNGKCKATQVENRIRKLEINLNAVVETPTDMKMASLHATKPKEKIVKFKSFTNYDVLKQPLIDELQRVLRLLPNEGKNEDEFDFDFDFEEDDLLFLASGNIKFAGVLKDLIYLIADMGLWCAYQASNVFINEFNKLEESITNDLHKEYFNKVKDALVFVNSSCQKFFAQVADTELDALQMFISNKIKRLLEILLEINNSYNNNEKALINRWKKCNEDYSDDESDDKVILEKKSNSYFRYNDNIQLRAIIFVERRITAWVLNHYLQKISEFLDQYSFIKSDFVVGLASNPSNLGYAKQKATHQQKKILTFRRGEINILVATRVVEEGMDIPTCNLVVRFDEPKDFRSYVQSKGRARSEDSYYISLINEMEARKLEEEIKLYKAIEEALYIICHERLPPSEKEMEEHLLNNILPPYYADKDNKQGPAVCAVDAISRINWYCQTLPHDKLTNLVPRILFKKRSKPHNAVLMFDENLEDYDFGDTESGFFDEFEIPQHTLSVIWYQAYLKFPLNSPCRDLIEGDIMETKKLAKQSVALKACEVLHKAGELTNDLLPVMRNPTEFLKQLIIDVKEESNGKPKPGSRKRRQVYLKQISNFLKGTPPQPEKALFLYQFKFTVIPQNDYDLPVVYSPDISNHLLGILITQQLPEIEIFPLHASNFKVWVEIKLVSQMILQEEQFFFLEYFQQYLVNSIFQIKCGLLNFDSKISNGNYFLAPLRDVGQRDDSCVIIDWDLLEIIFCNEHEINLQTEEERKKFDFDSNNYVNAVIQPCYATENYYFVSQICENMNSFSAFPTNSYTTFDDYYGRRYNINIQNKTHPLMEVKLIQPFSNMLTLKVAKTKKKKTATIHKRFFIPELCSIHSVPASLFIQAQYLPSVLYRLNSLLSAYELNLSSIQNIPLNIHDYASFTKWSDIELTCRNKALQIDTEVRWQTMFEKDISKMEVDCDVDEFDQKITPSPSIILKALTARACNDAFSYERLEILGDCFLKFFTSIYLFLNYPDIDEGRLSLGRSSIISNFHLYYVGKINNIPNIIHTEIFSPQYNWIPPGYVVDKDKEEILLNSKLPFHAWKYVWDDNISSMTPDQIWQLAKIKKFENPEEAEKDETFKVDKDVINEYTHQLINDKFVADSIEALIGAHLLYVGPEAALRFMIWLGLKVLPEACERSSDKIQLKPLKIPSSAYFFEHYKASDKLLATLDQFEIQIGYIFRDKSFLLQAMTHPSYNRNLVTDCYQRLEFLGDSILDYLIIWHIYMDSRNFFPGEITDIRSALVNNITFARLAVKNKFNCYLKNLSPKLFDNISIYLKYYDMEVEQQMYLISEDEATQDEEVEVPKALGDIFESVAAAIYLDSGMSLDVVWNVYSKMMMPLIEEYSACIPVEPVRQVYELIPTVKFTKEVDDHGEYRATATIAGILFEGRGKTYKLAKRNAANNILRNYKK